MSASDQLRSESYAVLPADLQRALCELEAAVWALALVPPVSSADRQAQLEYLVARRARYKLAQQRVAFLWLAIVVERTKP